MFAWKHTLNLNGRKHASFGPWISSIFLARLRFELHTPDLEGSVFLKIEFQIHQNLIFKIQTKLVSYEWWVMWRYLDQNLFRSWQEQQEQQEQQHNRKSTFLKTMKMVSMIWRWPIFLSFFLSFSLSLSLFLSFFLSLSLSFSFFLSVCLCFFFNTLLVSYAWF